MHDPSGALTRATTAALDVERVSFSYGGNLILKEISLRIQKGQILALLGPSGCGKSTLLKLVAGLLRPNAGAIRIMDRTAASPGEGIHLPPEQRGLGMVFQDYALWPHLTVGQNVEFPLRMAGIKAAQRRSRMEKMLDRVGLAGFASRRPGELSGGQQQRIALARAMVGHPSLVLFDEPLSNLDRELRATLAEEIADLMRARGLSGLYVTHDQAEAFAIADMVAVMNRGEILQQATPQNLVGMPASAEVAEFMAMGVVLDAERQRGGWVLKDGGLTLCAEADGPAGVSRARVLLRPEHIRFELHEKGVWTVRRKTFTGAAYRIRVRLGQGDRSAELTGLSDNALPVGAPVDVLIDSRNLNWFTER